MDLTIIIIIGVVAAVLGVVFKIYADGAQKEYTDERMRETFAAQSRGLEDELVTGEFAQYQEDVTDYIDSRISDKFPLLGKKLIQAGHKMKAMEWCTAVGAAGGVAAILIIIFLGKTFGAFVFVVAGFILFLVPAVAYFMIGLDIGKRINIFDEQFGVGLDVMSSSMKAGGTFLSSIRFIAEGSEPPLGTEMGIVSTELGLGTDMATALDRFKERVPSKNLLLFVIAIKVANQTGSALAPLLTSLSHVIVDRFRLQGMVNTAVSENLMGVIILAAFPWLVIPLLAFSWPDAYADFFIWSLGGLPAGKIIALLCFIWYSFGLSVMYKTVKSIDT